jgi:hypothetical protein
VAEAIGLKAELHGEVRLVDLRARPDYQVNVGRAPVGFIELKRPGKTADPRSYRREDAEQGTVASDGQLPRRPPLRSQNATIRLAIERFEKFSRTSTWAEAPLGDSSAMSFAQMQQCRLDSPRNGAAQRLGEPTNSQRSQLSAAPQSEEFAASATSAIPMTRNATLPEPIVARMHQATEAFFRALPRQHSICGASRWRTCGCASYSVTSCDLRILVQ